MNWWEGENRPIDNEVSRFLAQKRREEAERRKAEEYANSHEGVLNWLKPWRVLKRVLSKPTNEENAMNNVDKAHVLKLRAKLARDPDNVYIKTMLRDLGERVD